MCSLVQSSGHNVIFSTFTHLNYRYLKNIPFCSIVTEQIYMQLDRRRAIYAKSVAFCEHFILRSVFFLLTKDDIIKSKKHVVGSSANKELRKVFQEPWNKKND